MDMIQHYVQRQVCVDAVPDTHAAVIRDGVNPAAVKQRGHDSAIFAVGRGGCQSHVVLQVVLPKASEWHLVTHSDAPAATMRAMTMQ